MEGGTKEPKGGNPLGARKRKQSDLNQGPNIHEWCNIPVCHRTASRVVPPFSLGLGPIFEDSFRTQIFVLLCSNACEQVLVGRLYLGLCKESWVDEIEPNCLCQGRIDEQIFLAESFVLLCAMFPNQVLVASVCLGLCREP